MSTPTWFWLSRRFDEPVSGEGEPGGRITRVHRPSLSRGRFPMLETTILPDPKQLCLRLLVQEPNGIRAVVATTATEAVCPLCSHRSARIHSRYQRHIADVPWHGVPLRLELHLRRFFCDQPNCPRQIFAERLPGVVEPYARRTVQLAEALTLLGFAVGGEAGARLARRLADLKTETSPDTLLRLLRRETSAAARTPRVLGVDDFAFHRGIRYGTILVDLERHHVIDLLPDREARTFAAWLRAHPGIGFISRDRGGAYAEAAQQAAPGAIQIADRFHLLANLGMALDRLLTREHAAVSTVARSLQTRAQHEQAEREAEVAQHPRVPTTRAERLHLAAEARRQARYAHLDALQQEGHSIQAMARLAGVARNTVRRYLRSGARWSRPREDDALTPVIALPPIYGHGGRQGNTTVPCCWLNSALRALLVPRPPCVSTSWPGVPGRVVRVANRPMRPAAQLAQALVGERSLPAKRGGSCSSPSTSSMLRNKPIVSSCARSR